MNISPEKLRSSASAIINGAKEAIDWTNIVKKSSPRLERESDSLIERLRRTRNLCRRLSQAASRPMAVGFFGLSQAGKSYLISSLARGVNGKLETVLDGEELDFIDHINPPGGGKEATGLVTRFTRTPIKTQPGFPVQLSLLSEADLVKILGNSFFCDFDREKVAFDPDANDIRILLNELASRKQSKALGGLDEDDLVDIRDYFDKRFKKSMEALPADYWLHAQGLAPYLAAPDRARLFAPLWGNFPEFIDAYLSLQKALEILSFAPIVNAPTEALATKEGGEYEQTNSIMNVDAVRLRFGQDQGDTVRIVPIVDDAPLAAEPIQRSIIAALTREMVCVLSKEPRVDLLEYVDLLDFPGYRGRMGLGSVAEAATADKGSNPVGTLLLRGKVACLFERYTDDQEMNVLVLCNASNEQINITDLGPVLDSWVWATQGRNQDERSRRPPGLLYALTKLDIRLSANLNQTENNLDMSWSGMIDSVLLERFGKNEWVQRWSHDKPFDNLFLVRKPGMATGIVEVANDVETGVVPAVADKIATMRKTFAENEKIRAHFSDPDRAFDAMIRPDDGGIGRIVDHLRKVTSLSAKQDRIAEQIKAIEDDVVSAWLGSFYRAEGADEMIQKKEIAKKVLGALQKNGGAFGELLRALQVNPGHLRSLYVSAEAQREEKEEKEAESSSPLASGNNLISLDFDLDFDLGGDSFLKKEEKETAPAPRNTRASRFGKAAISDWIRQMRQLSEAPEMLRALGFQAESMRLLVEEIITAATRDRLEEKLVETLEEAEIQSGATRNLLADRQAQVTAVFINGFVDWLGLTDRVKYPNLSLFQSPPPLADRELPRLSEKPLKFTEINIGDWFKAFYFIATENVGHSAGSEISMQQNESLGAIIRRIKTASLVSAAE